MKNFNWMISFVLMTGVTQMVWAADKVVAPLKDASDTPKIEYTFNREIPLERLSKSNPLKHSFEFTGSKCSARAGSYGGTDRSCICTLVLVTPMEKEKVKIAANTVWQVNKIVKRADNAHAEAIEIFLVSNPDIKMHLQCDLHADYGTYRSLQWQAYYESNPFAPESILGMTDFSEDSGFGYNEVISVKSTNTPTSMEYFRGDNQDYYLPGAIN